MALEPKIPALNYTAAQWASMPATERALMLAAQFCDVYKVEEVPHGSNKGPWVETFQRFAESGPGQPWCASWAYYCLAKAGVMWHPLYPAAVTSHVLKARQMDRLKTVPKRGYLFFYSGTGRSHIGFVTDFDNGYIHTLEGNGSPDGGREGYAVVRHQRSAAGVDGFINLEGLV